MHVSFQQMGGNSPHQKTVSIKKNTYVNFAVSCGVCSPGWNSYMKRSEKLVGKFESNS